MKRIDLVFRTVGERTSDIALDFAIKNIKPDKIYIIKEVKPFNKAMQEILKIKFEGDYIVFMDADCITMENLRPFLEKNTNAYTDCFVLDKFRGVIHIGVHITRRDVFEKMREVEISENDLKYILRPESRIRNIALEALNEEKSFKRFRIFHDFFQYYKDIFTKYAIRELRSRSELSKMKLDICMKNWHNDDFDYIVAREAVKYTRKKIPLNAPPVKISKFIIKLPKIAQKKLAELKILEKKPLKIKEVLDLRAAFNVMDPTESKSKIFCIGLSRTGTKSLTVALYILGYNIIHYPHDNDTLQDLINGNYDFTTLQDYDGISDITVSPYYAQLYEIHPNSKFILTIRDKEAWLNSFEKHWSDRPPFDDPTQNVTYMKIRRLLRASVYGTYRFNRNRMSYVYDLHYKNVVEFFKDKPGSLLLLNIFEKDAWKKLCEFLNLPSIEVEKFPDIKTNEHLFEIL